jgi:TPR repeat protein
MQSSHQAARSKNLEQVIEYFRKAADQGNPNAIFQLGMSCAEGKENAKNLDQAQKDVKKGADAGNASAEAAKTTKELHA